MRNVIVLLLAATLLIPVGALSADKPVVNVNPKTHPNLAQAQKLARQAYRSIVVALKANEGDMEGHAQKAKELLDQVNVELKAAAQFAAAPSK